MIRNERIAMGVLVAACLGLMGWNLSLQSQIATLGAQRDAPSTDPVPAVASAQLPDRPARRTPDRRARRTPAEGPPVERERRGPPPEGAAEASDRPDRGERPERTEAEWEAMRAKMETATVDVVEAYATQHGWEAETSEEVLSIFLETGEAIGAVWGKMHEGDTSHFQARREMGEIRDAAGEDVSALVGQEAYEELEEHLWEARRETWRHD